MKKTVVLGIAMVSMVSSTQLANAKDIFIYGENGNELMVSTLNNDGKTITPKLKYKYQYDDNEKMVEKKAYRWNSELKHWEPLYIITMNAGIKCPGKRIQLSFLGINVGFNEATCTIASPTEGR